MNTHCAVTADLNRYLDQLDADEARDNFIESFKHDLLKPGAEYDPMEPDNFAEAISNSSHAWFKTLTALLIAGDGEKVIAFQCDRSNTYWQLVAEGDAEKEIQRRVEDNFTEPYGD